MFGFLLAITTFFNNMRMDFKAKKVEARKKISEIKARVDKRSEELLGNKDGQKIKPVDKAIAMLLYLLALMVALAEIIVMVVALFKYFLILLVALVVIVIIFAFLALVHALNVDWQQYLDDIKSDEGASCKNVTTGVSGGTLSWTREELSASGSALSTYEKNFYKFGILAKEGLEGTLTGSKTVTKEGLDEHTLLIMTIGILSTEGIPSSLSSIDAFVNPTNKSYNSLGYGAWGMHKSDKLTDYFNSTQVSTISKLYKPSATPTYTADFAPWGIAIAQAHNQQKMNYLDGKMKQYNIDLDKIAADYGIVANVAEFKTVSYLSMIQALFHGAQFSHFDTQARFWASMFVLSDPQNDANRSFANYQIVKKNPSSKSIFDEGEPTRYIYVGGQKFRSIGSGGDPSTFPSPEAGSSKPSVQILLNGQPINTSLYSYIYTNSPRKEDMVKNWELMKSLNGSDWLLNWHYGINSYLVGSRVERELSEAMSITGKTSEQVTKTVCTSKEGVSDTVASTPSGNFKVTKGKSNIVFNGVPMEEYTQKKFATVSPATKTYITRLKKYWGTSATLSNPNANANKLGYKDEKFGVPFMSQTYDEEYLLLPWYPGGDTYKISACMVYSYAYAASALLGVMITPPEMGSLMYLEGKLTPTGVDTYGMPSIFKGLGLKAENSTYANGGKSRVDSTLSKGGVVVIRVGRSAVKFTSDQHFMVITGKDVIGGKEQYHVYTSSYANQSMTRYTWAQIDGAIKPAQSRKNPFMYITKE